MDDFSLASLKESRNEWCIQLIQKLSPAIVAGLATIFAESYKLCTSTNEQSKYLMTFQILIFLHYISLFIRCIYLLPGKFTLIFIYMK